MIRIYNDNLGRILHFSLYQRMYNFCVKHNPEFPADMVVNAWLSRIYNNDLTLHLLAEVDDNYTITEHALIDVQTFLNNKVIYCHQVQHDKPASLSHAVELMEYIDKLREHEGAICSVFSLTEAKHAKAFEKRHNYHILRTVMIKTSEAESEEDG